MYSEESSGFSADADWPSATEMMNDEIPYSGKT